MKIKYNRFALIPNTCSICGKGFWLEPYKRDIQEGFSPLGGYHIFETDICKECCNKESEEQGISEISETEIKSMTKEQNYMRGYADGKFDVLDKIRAEIMSKDGLEEALEIIDKYKAESEE